MHLAIDIGDAHIAAGRAGIEISFDPTCLDAPAGSSQMDIPGADIGRDIAAGGFNVDPPLDLRNMNAPP